MTGSVRRLPSVLRASISPPHPLPLRIVSVRRSRRATQRNGSGQLLRGIPTVSALPTPPVVQSYGKHGRRASTTTASVTQNASRISMHSPIAGSAVTTRCARKVNGKLAVRVRVTTVSARHTARHATRQQNGSRLRLDLSTTAFARSSIRVRQARASLPHQPCAPTAHASHARRAGTNPPQVTLVRAQNVARASSPRSLALAAAEIVQLASTRTSLARHRARSVPKVRMARAGTLSWAPVVRIAASTAPRVAISRQPVLLPVSNAALPAHQDKTMLAAVAACRARARPARVATLAAALKCSLRSRSSST